MNLSLRIMGVGKFKRSHHENIGFVLSRMNSNHLLENGCFLTGSSAISLQIKEFRDAVDLNFICSSKEGYKKILCEIIEGNVEYLFGDEVSPSVDFRPFRWGVMGQVVSKGVPISVDIFKADSSLNLSGAQSERLGVPVLSNHDLFVQKIWATSDRGSELNPEYHNRDFIDLCLMSAAWGGLTRSALDVASEEYGRAIVSKSLLNGVGRISDRLVLKKCMEGLGMDAGFEDVVRLSCERIREQALLLVGKRPQRENRSVFMPKYPDFEDLTLVTSNQNKIREYLEIAGDRLDIQPGTDLREVMGTADEIIVYKALEAGEGKLVEDTVLVVDGAECVDVRYKIPEILSGAIPVGTPLKLQVRLGVLWQGNVFTFLGEASGVSCEKDGDGFGVDPVFLVAEAGETFASLARKGLKSIFSPRTLALKSLEDHVAHSVHVADYIPAWKGQYQVDNLKAKEPPEPSP